MSCGAIRDVLKTSVVYKSYTRYANPSRRLSSQSSRNLSRYVSVLIHSEKIVIVNPTRFPARAGLIAEMELPHQANAADLGDAMSGLTVIGWGCYKLKQHAFAR